MPTVTTYIVDRIEDGEWVVLESTSGETIEVPATWAPDGVSEGDVLRAEEQQEDGRSSISFTIDPDHTSARRERLREKRRRLRRGPDGDLQL